MNQENRESGRCNTAYSNPGKLPKLQHLCIHCIARTERWSRSEILRAEAGKRTAAPFPAPLSPLAALFLRCAPESYLLTKPNTFQHNREASVATLRWCSGSSRNAVRLPSGTSVQLRRNPQFDQVSSKRNAIHTSNPVSSPSRLHSRVLKSNADVCAQFSLDRTTLHR